MIPRPFLTILVALGLFLPVLVCVLLAVEGLLGAMGDVAGQVALQRLRLGSLVLWGTNLIGLILCLGIQQLAAHQLEQQPLRPRPWRPMPTPSNLGTGEQATDSSPLE